MNYILKLDLSGSNPDNRIENELHLLETISGKNDRIICPKHGSFFADTLEVREHLTGKPLTRDVHYKTAYHDGEYSEIIGRDIESLIIITDDKVAREVRISYQALGGKLEIERDFLYSQLTLVGDDYITYSFDDIVGTPREWVGDENHPHEFWQVYGYDSLIENLDLITKSIKYGKVGIFSSLEEYMEIYKELIMRAIESYEENLQHLEDYDNPHGDDKEKIGLGEIHNWPLSNLTTSTDTARSDVYMGISGVTSLYNRFIFPGLSAHLVDYNNPHKTNHTHIGVYSKEEVDGFFADRLLRISPAHDTKLFDGKTVATFTNEVRTNLAASNVDANTTFNGNMIADNFDSTRAFSVFFGDGQLKPFDSVKPTNVHRGWKWLHSRGVANSESSAWMTVIGAQAEPGEKIFKSFWFKPNTRHDAISFLIGKREANGTTTRII